MLECEIYSAQRKPLAEAISEWRASMRGFSAQEALCWAIDNKMPAPVMMPTEGRTAAGACPYEPKIGPNVAVEPPYPLPPLALNPV